MIQAIEKKLINKEDLSQEEIKIFLDYIVTSIRTIIDDETFINKCDLVQGIIGRYLNKLNITNHPCITNKCVMPNVVGHSFIVATINNNDYIIDPSFIQFAYIEFNDMYINHLKVKSKSPIEYAINIDKDLTRTLMANGYMELNEESAYWYGNTFYHTLTNIKDDYKFKDIPGKELIEKFMEGNEVLRKYEYPEIGEQDITKFK